MQSCNDYWCENHGKHSGKCVGCKGRHTDRKDRETRLDTPRKGFEQVGAMPPLVKHNQTNSM